MPDIRTIHTYIVIVPKSSLVLKIWQEFLLKKCIPAYILFTYIKYHIIYKSVLHFLLHHNETHHSMLKVENKNA